MNTLQKQLFETIEIIADSKVKNLKFDKTIEAIVVSVDKANAGEYTVRYQDIMFSAFTSNNTTKYELDDNVMILVPDGDMSNKKTIISSSKKQGEEYVDIEEVVDRVGINFVDEKKDFEIQVSTFKDETVGFKIKADQMVSHYPGQTTLLIGAEIYSNISEEDLNGEYGIAIDCVVMNNTGEEIPHTFKFSTLNVTGNPYQSRGYKETRIPLLEERLLRVTSARVYSKGFSKGNENVRFKNLVVEYVNIRDQADSEFSGNILTPKGTHFKSGVVYPDESLPLIMEFKQKGEVLETDAVDYKWFILDAEVSTPDSNLGYHPDAGLGWKWIKPADYPENLIKGANTRVLEVFASFIPNFTTFKCIATYRGTQISSNVTIVDHTDEIQTTIESSNGISFVNSVGSTVLTCSCLQNGQPIEKPLIYEWSRISISGEVQLIKKSPQNTIDVSARDIDIKTVYLCEVSISNESRPISTGSITLVNVVDGSTQGAVIVGGFRTALYQANGDAPLNFNSDLFQFDVYRNGEKVTSNYTWKWIIPPETETLLTMEGADVEADGRRTSTGKTLRLGLAPSFNFNKNNNVLLLEVIYTENFTDYKIQAEAPIAITKVGSNGADGATGKPGMDGHTYVCEIQGGNPTIVYDGDGLHPQPATTNEFILMFSKDGDTGLANKVSRVEWNIQSADSSLLSFFGENKSIRTITTIQDLNGGEGNPHKIRLVADDSWSIDKFNNFISVKITYENQVFRETYPISVSKNGSVGYTINTNPSTFTFNAGEDNYVTENRILEIIFDVVDGSGKPSSFLIESFTTPNGVEVSRNSLGTGVLFKIINDSLMQSEGTVDFVIKIDSKRFKQTFSYSKVLNGSSPYLLTIISSNGMVFKRGQVSTILTAAVFKGDTLVDPVEIQNNLEWRKIDKDGNIATGWTPNYVNGQRHKIIITPEDILERATFDCSLNI